MYHGRFVRRVGCRRVAVFARACGAASTDGDSVARVCGLAVAFFLAFGLAVIAASAPVCESFGPVVTTAGSGSCTLTGSISGSRIRRATKRPAPGGRWYRCRTSKSDLEEGDEGSSGVAQAMPAGAATADPMPSATASAPTRPMCAVPQWRAPPHRPPADHRGERRPGQLHEAAVIVGSVTVARRRRWLFGGFAALRLCAGTVPRLRITRDEVSRKAGICRPVLAVFAR